MAGTLQPLSQNFPIVDANGQPTRYFTEWAQQKQEDIGTALTLTDLTDFLAAHLLQAGSGIGLTPDGDLNDSPTISAKVQEILDQITATRGAVLFRGAAAWTPLLPGTAGYLLQTNGAGADPTWVAPPTGGGGAITKIASQTLAANAASITFSAIPSTYTDLFIIGQARSNVAATNDPVRLTLNADTAAHYDFERENRFGNVDGNAIAYIEAAVIAGSTAPANVADTFLIEIDNYAATVFHKMVRGIGDIMTGTGAGQIFRSISSGRWQSTAAVNQVSLASPASQFIIGSKFTLYGRA